MLNDHGPTAALRPLTGRAAELADRVGAQLAGQAPLGVAYSGGVDSALLLALAVRTLGAEQVRPILAVSGSLARREHRAALAQAAQIGVQVVEVATREQELPAYQANGADRCFHCRDELFSLIDDELIPGLGLQAIAYGENLDDSARPDRPGARAAVEHRVLKPLADAGLTKADVRFVARELGLLAADKPSAPCLASRIPHGQPVTPERLTQIEAAEDAVLAEGFSDCRVRHHGEIARIEVPTGELARLCEPEVRARLASQLRAIGFRFVTADLDGIQSGAFTLPLVMVRSHA
ncbi:MAG: ATP-dependent sacrificial sulfur transferase LarE [Acidobacteriota bacterium]|nr:ATP-dependent sacrificial sulfur transferase LarE [Acidobacteriota bacterium]